MEVISLSLDEKSLDKLDEIEAHSSFNGRSELLRKAIDNYYRANRDIERISGSINAVIVVKHPHGKEGQVAHIAHKFDGILKTQLHSKLDGSSCTEILQVEGTSEKVKNLYKSLDGSKNTESVQIVQN